MKIQQKKRCTIPANAVSMRWCVAQEVTAAGVKIERYGIKCRTYAEAFDRAAKLNNENRAGKAAVNESASEGGGQL